MPIFYVLSCVSTVFMLLEYKHYSTLHDLFFFPLHDIIFLSRYFDLINIDAEQQHMLTLHLMSGRKTEVPKITNLIPNQNEFNFYQIFDY